MEKKIFSWIIETVDTYHIYRNISNTDLDFAKEFSEDELFSLQGPYSEEELNLRIEVLKSLKDVKKFKEVNLDCERFWVVKIDGSSRYEYYPNATKSQVDEYLKTSGKIDKAKFVNVSDSGENSKKLVESLKLSSRVETIILDQKKSNWIVGGGISKDYLFIDKTWLEVYNHISEKDAEGTIHGPYTWAEIKVKFVNTDYSWSTWEVKV